MWKQRRHSHFLSIMLVVKFIFKNTIIFESAVSLGNRVGSNQEVWNLNELGRIKKSKIRSIHLISNLFLTYFAFSHIQVEINTHLQWKTPPPPPVIFGVTVSTMVSTWVYNFGLFLYIGYPQLRILLKTFSSLKTFFQFCRVILFTLVEKFQVFHYHAVNLNPGILRWKGMVFQIFQDIGSAHSINNNNNTPL